MDVKRFTGKARFVEDRDFKVAKEIQKLGEMTGGTPPDKAKDLPFIHRGVRNVGLSVTLNRNEKARAIQMTAPDEESSVVSVTLDAFGAQAFAYAQFGAGGVFSEIEVDIVRGLTFDLAGSFVQVDLINDTTVIGGSAALIKAFAAWMPSGAHPSSRPTRTFKRTVGYIQSGYQLPVTAGQSLDAVAAAASRIIVPPNFAKDIIVRRTPSTEPFTLTFRDETGAVILYQMSFGAGADMDTPIELSNDCKLVGITNDGANPTSYRAIFGLGF